jgi:hypothetical protein
MRSLSCLILFSDQGSETANFSSTTLVTFCNHKIIKILGS